MAKHEPQTLETVEQRIGSEAKRLRENAGLTLRTFAEQAGFSARFMLQLENGVVSPSIASLEKIALTQLSELGVESGNDTNDPSGDSKGGAEARIPQR